MKQLLSFIPLLLAWAAAANATPESELPLEATSPWSLSSTASSCELRRHFGENEGQILLTIIQDPKFGVLEIELITPRFSTIRVNRTGEYSFGNSAEKSKIYASIHPDMDKGKSVWRIVGVNPNILTNGMEDSALIIEVKEMANLNLQIGDLSEPAKAFKTCRLDLFKKFGMDFDLLSKLKQLPQPKGNYGRWVMISDYPQAAFKLELEGLTQFKLDVDSDGRVTNCTILVSSGHSQLDRTTCTKASARARFDPALDQNDKPTAAPWVSSVRWQVPR